GRGGWPTYSSAGLEGVGGTVGTGPRARLGHITDPDGRPTDRSAGLEGVGGAEGTGPRAALRRLTGPHRSTADRGRGLELTGGRATDARLPVLGTQVALLAARHQAIATEGALYSKHYTAPARPAAERGAVQVARAVLDQASIGVGSSGVDKRGEDGKGAAGRQLVQR